MFESQNIEHQQTSDNESVPEHQNETFTGRPHRTNLVHGVNRLEMILNRKYYENVQFTSIGENNDHGWIHNCLRIS